MKHHISVFGMLTCVLLAAPLGAQDVRITIDTPMAPPGPSRYIDAWTRMIDKINSHKKRIDGRMMYPRMHGDDGWYAYEPTPWSQGALERYYWTCDPRDHARVADDPWVAWLDGKHPGIRNERRHIIATPLPDVSRVRRSDQPCSGVRLAERYLTLARARKQTESIEDHQQRGAHIGCDGGPKRGVAGKREGHEDGFDCQRKGDVLANDAERAA